MKNIYPFLNPVEWIKAYQFHKKNASYDKSTFDLELALYSKILTNNLLHYGYFEDVNIQPDEISFKLLEEAQEKYCYNIIQQISNTNDTILDVGCGMGGFAKILTDQKLKVEVLTPNKNQIDFIKANQPKLKSYHYKFEDFDSSQQYGTIINSESLQYIQLDDAFKKVNRFLLPDGRWIIVDYFRLHENGVSKSAHLLEKFKQKVEEHHWSIVYEKDITLNVLPMLKYINIYIERFLMPLKHFGYEKLRFKKGWLYYLSKRIREGIDKKISKEIAAVDPQLFIDEKKYILFVLEKKS